MLPLHLCLRRPLGISKSPSLLSLSAQIAPRRWLPRSSLRPSSQLHRPNTGHDRTPKFHAEFLRDNPTFDLPKFSESFKPGILKQIIFFAGSSLVIFHLSAAFTDIQTKRWSAELTRLWSVGVPSSDEIRRARLMALASVLQENLNSIQKALESIPRIIAYPIIVGYARLAEDYLNCSEGRKAAYKIIAINSLVWFLWQIPRLKPFMGRNFAHNPLSGRSTTLLTSVFSHESFLHLVFNSIALASFGSAAGTFLARYQSRNKDGIQESTPQHHFTALFMTAGIFASLVSHVVSARILYPQLVSRLSSLNTTTGRGVFRHPLSPASKAAAQDSVRDIRPSLGASGAIYALVTTTALAYPDAQVSLLFTIPVPITWGVGGLVAMDIMGVIRGWRMFDHYAHLAGASFGVFYYYYGVEYWNSLRKIYMYA